MAGVLGGAVLAMFAVLLGVTLLGPRGALLGVLMGLGLITWYLGGAVIALVGGLIGGALTE